MKATVYHGVRDVRVETVPDPKIKDQNDVILKITKSAICGSDLHFYRGNIPLDDGFIIGHEFMGVVEEAGKGVKYFKKGDKAVAPFWVSCGVCANCRNGFPTSCTGGGGGFGSGEQFGGFSGGQAEYVRVPFADTTLEKVPEGIADERVLFLGDILSTAYFCAEWGNIKPGNTVVVFGDGPLGLLATASAKLFGPSRIITVGHHDFRLDLAKKMGCDIAINSKNGNTSEKILEITHGQGADVALECIGSANAILDAIKIARPGGTISFIGFTTQELPIPLLNFFLKDLTFRGGSCLVKNYIRKLMPLIETDKIDPTAVITHDLPLADAPRGYELMDSKAENAIKVVLTP